MVTAVMPATPGRPDPADLLLCGHHYQASRAALEAAGAVVFDETGAVVKSASMSIDMGTVPADTASQR
jgi:hypothetical protein